jgi:hypothetical protein
MQYKATSSLCDDLSANVLLEFSKKVIPSSDIDGRNIQKVENQDPIINLDVEMVYTRISDAFAHRDESRLFSNFDFLGRYLTVANLPRPNGSFKNELHHIIMECCCAEVSGRLLSCTLSLISHLFQKRTFIARGLFDIGIWERVTSLIEPSRFLQVFECLNAIAISLGDLILEKPNISYFLELTDAMESEGFWKLMNSFASFKTLPKGFATCLIHRIDEKWLSFSSVIRIHAISILSKLKRILSEEEWIIHVSALVPLVYSGFVLDDIRLADIAIHAYVQMIEFGIHFNVGYCYFQYFMEMLNRAEYSELGLFAISKILIWIENARSVFLELGLVKVAVESEEVSFERKRDWILVICELIRFVDRRVFEIVIQERVIPWFLDFVESRAAEEYIVEVMRCIRDLFVFSENIGQKELFLSCFEGDSGIEVLSNLGSLNEEIRSCVALLLGELENPV